MYPASMKADWLFWLLAVMSITCSASDLSLPPDPPTAFWAEHSRARSALNQSSLVVHPADLAPFVCGCRRWWQEEVKRWLDYRLALGASLLRLFGAQRLAWHTRGARLRSWRGRSCGGSWRQLGFLRAAVLEPARSPLAAAAGAQSSHHRAASAAC